LASGYRHSGGKTEAVIARYNYDGGLDNTFGSSGKTIAVYPFSVTLNSIVSLPDGKILAYGYAGANMFLRYTADGIVDESFGSNGIVQVPMGSITNWGRGVAIHEAKILAAGVDNGKISVMRYNLDGTVDVSFGRSGIAAGPQSGYAQSIAVQSSGDIVVNGFISSQGSIVAKFHSDGTLDRLSGSDGAVSFFPALSRSYDLAVKDDRLYVSGSTHVSPQTGLIKGYTIGCQRLYFEDLDGDGYGKSDVQISSCTQNEGLAKVAGDCNDQDSQVHPGGTDICNNKDDDCDGQIDEDYIIKTFYQDSDGDGYGNAAVSSDACAQPTGYVTNSTDFDDSEPLAYPGATEVCDGIDNDGNTQIDDGVKTTFYRDGDGDGFGYYHDSLQSCAAPGGYVANGSDCNDNNSFIKPGAVEACGDGTDNNCDGQVDENCNNKTVLSINNVAVYESQLKAVLTVTLSRRLSVAAKVDYKTVDGSAKSKGTRTSSADYTAISGTLMIPAGSQTATITVTIANDGINEPSETFTVQLGKPVNAAIQTGAGTVTIMNGGNTSVVEAEPLGDALVVRVSPSPSTNRFRFYSETGNKKPLQIRIFDNLGRLVEARSNVMPNSTIYFGESLRAGIYYVEVLQGTERKHIKLIKSLN
jgi:uncharacterized delta-60 repeat protein